MEKSSPSLLILTEKVKIRSILPMAFAMVSLSDGDHFWDPQLLVAFFRDGILFMCYCGTTKLMSTSSHFKLGL